MAYYQNKHALTKELSMFLAKKKWDENIDWGMKIEIPTVSIDNKNLLRRKAHEPFRR